MFLHLQNKWRSLSNTWRWRNLKMGPQVNVMWWLANRGTGWWKDMSRKKWKIRLILHSNEFYSGTPYKLLYDQCDQKSYIRRHVNKITILILVFGYPWFPAGNWPRRLPQMGLSRLAVRNVDQPNGRPWLRRRHFPHAQLEPKRIAQTTNTSAALRFLAFGIRWMAGILANAHEFIGEYL